MNLSDHPDAFARRRMLEEVFEELAEHQPASESRRDCANDGEHATHGSEPDESTHYENDDRLTQDLS